MGGEPGVDAKRTSPRLNASQENTQQEEAPKPPSTRLIVDRQPDVPALIAVDETTLSLQWSPVSITVRSTQIRVVECLEAYALEMQQVEVNADTGEADIKEERWSIQYSGPATYVQVKGLRPGRNYAVRVACRPIVTDPEVFIELAAPSEILLVRTPATPPSAPLLPTLSVRQRNALKYKWSEPSENGGHPILAYVVHCHPPPEGFEGTPTPEGMFEIYRGLEKSLTMKRLVPGVKYSVRVMAINCIGESPFSPIATFSTQATVPSAPENLTVSSSGQDSAVLQWEAVAGNGAEVSGYQVMMDDGQGGDFNFVGHTQEPQFAISGLRSGLSYRFRVKAENSEGISQWSPVCLAQTAATAPLAPPPPFRENSTHSSITITWRPPEYDGGSPLFGYEVEIQPKSEPAKRDFAKSENKWVRVYEGKDTMHTLGSLRAGCTYRVRVRAMNCIGAGAYSFPADLATSPASPEAPGAPAVGNRAQHALTVLWDAPQHDGGASIVSYRLAHRLAGPVEELKSTNRRNNSGDWAAAKTGGGEDAAAFRIAYDGAERKAEIQGLDPGMKYEFRVNASNKQGTSSWSNTAILTTKAGLPLSPTLSTITHGSAPRSLDLSWVKPYGQGAPVDSYIVQMKMAEKLTSYVQEEDEQPIQIGTYSPATVASNATAIENCNGNGNGISPHEGSADEGGAAPASEPLSSSLFEDASFITVYHGSETHCTVTDLKPNCEYLFRMRAFNSVGASPWSGSISAVTAAASPSAPQHLHCSQALETKLTLTWESPAFDYGAAVTVYQLEVAPASRGGGQRASDKASWRSVFKGNSLEHLVEDLQPGQQYCARVRAQNSCGWGPWSDILTSATQAAVPGAPEAPVASGRTGTSVRLSWSTPSESNGSSVTEYELQMAPVTESQLQWFTLVNGIDTNWKVSDLSPGSKYYFKVRASNAVGAGPWSPLTVVETALMPPLEPTNIEIATAAEEAGGAVFLSWTPPDTEEQRASCTGYEIECTSSSAAAAAAKSGAPHKSGSAKSAASTVVKHTCSGKATEFKLSSLKEGKWTVRLRAIGADGAGHGGWSPAATVHIVGHVGMHHGNGSDLAMAVAAANGGGQGRQRKNKKNRSMDQKDTASVGSGASEDSHNVKGHTRGQALGTKTAVAKAKPRPKTFVSTLARLAGISESSFKSLLWGVLAIIVTAALFLTIYG